MSQSFTLRLPSHLARWIKDTADENGITRSQIVISILQDNMQDTKSYEQPDALHPPLQDKVQDSLVQLCEALRDSTKQQRELTEQLARLTALGEPQLVTPHLPKRKGSKRSKLYVYKGREATVQEHIAAALPQLTSRQTSLARDNINRMIRGRSDQKSERRSPEDAIGYEIERWQRKMGS